MPLFELAKNTFKDEIRDYYCGLTFTETLIKNDETEAFEGT